jgi:hypothetical protein
MESIATWLAPIATTIAALMTASNLGTRITGWGFVVFTIGSLAWLALGIATGQSNLLWQNIILVGGVGETVRRVDWRDLSVDEDRLTTHLDQLAFDQLDQLEKDDWR